MSLSHYEVISELANRRRSYDGAIGSRHRHALPSCRNLNLRFPVRTKTLFYFTAFSYGCFFFSFTSLVVEPKCLTSEKRELALQAPYQNSFTNNNLIHQYILELQMVLIETRKQMTNARSRFVFTGRTFINMPNGCSYLTRYKPLAI